MSTRNQKLPKINEKTKQSWRRVRHDESAGGVAYRRHPHAETWQIALIATRGGERWQLPKGSREGDETALETAIREVHEEVGLRTEHVRDLTSIDYWYWDTYRREVPELVHKTVDFFLLRTVGGVLNSDCFEVDDAAWYTIEDALDTLTFKGEVAVVQMALQVLQEISPTQHPSEPTGA